MKSKKLTLIFLFSCLYALISSANEALITMSLNMILNSSAFAHQGKIPRQFTCEGPDVSPELRWSNIPPNTKSLALIVDDPDAPDPAAPKLTWVHWLLYNIPTNASELPEHVSSQDLPAGTREGLNDWQQTGYRGPCPPIGKHRYFFKLYALDIELPDLNLPNKKQLEQAMTGHIISHAELIGTYQK